jgi:hypothetical protein
MEAKYTYSVNFYKKVEGLGWMFHSFKTTDDAVQLHINSLAAQQARGAVRAIDAIKLR